MEHQKLEISSLNELHKGEVQVVYSLTKENNAYRIKETGRQSFLENKRVLVNIALVALKDGNPAKYLFIT